MSIFLPVILVVAAAFSFGLVEIDDYDVWWHIKCGELIVREGWMPRTEIFSYTANGAEWVDGYTLPQIGMYAVYAIGGDNGISIAGAMVFATIFLAAFFVAGREKNNLPAALLISIPALIISQRAFFPKPAILTPLFALATLYLLERYRKSGGRSLWALAPLMVLWTNSHPGFFMGPALTFCYLIAHIKDKKAAKSYAQALILQVFSTLINPYAWKIHYSSISFLLNPEYKSTVLEWKYLFDRHNPEPLITIVAYIAVVALIAVGIFVARKKIRIERVMILAMTAAMALTSVRNLLLFGALAIPLFAWTINDALDEKKFDISAKKILATGIFSAIAAFFLIWFSATDRFYIATQTIRKSGIGESTMRFPAGACALLNSESIRGNIFHPYAWGGYLIEKLYPKYKVLIDGRIYPYPPQLLEYITKIASNPAMFDEFASNRDIRVAMVSVHDKSYINLAAKLARSPDWAAVFAEPSGILFLKRGAGNDNVIARREIDIFQHPPIFTTREQGRELGIFDRAEVPHEAMSWASFYERAGRFDIAAKCLETGLGYLPETPDLRAWLGILLIKTGRYEDGFKYINVEIANNPDNALALRGLADYFIAKRDFRNAEQTLLRLMEISGPSAQLWSYLGVVSFNLGDYRRAAEYFTEALKLAPDDYDSAIKLARSLEKFDERATMEAYSRAVYIMQKRGVSQKEIEPIIEKLKNYAPR